MNKKTVIPISIVLVVAFSIYYYINRDHRNIDTENAAYSLEIAVLQQEFAFNDSLALNKYQDQTIELIAQVTTVDTENKGVVLDKIVFATFNDSLPKDILLGKVYKVKGRFLGYDELLDEFKMDQSSIVKEKINNNN